MQPTRNLWGSSSSFISLTSSLEDESYAISIAVSYPYTDMEAIASKFLYLGEVNGKSTMTREVAPSAKAL